MSDILKEQNVNVQVKRFFNLEDDHANYVVVATYKISAEEHAEQIMRETGIEFSYPSVSYDEAKASGVFDWSEMSDERVASTRVHRQEAEHPDPVPLAASDVGDWFCSEF